VKNGIEDGDDRGEEVGRAGRLGQDPIHRPMSDAFKDHERRLVIIPIPLPPIGRFQHPQMGLGCWVRPTDRPLRIGQKMPGTGRVVEGGSSSASPQFPHDRV